MLISMDTPRRLTTFAVLVVGATLVTMPALGAMGTGIAPAAETENATGMQMAAFAQSTAAEANDTVESGVWQAEYAEADNETRADLVLNRTERLEQRMERLQERSRALEAAKENGSMNEVAYTARASALQAQMDGLRAALQQTDAAARETGVNRTRLAHLRENASNMTGPEVAAIARNLTHAGGPPATPPGSPGGPGAAPGNGTDAANGTDSGNATGQEAGTDRSPGGPGAGSDNPDAGSGGEGQPGAPDA